MESRDAQARRPEHAREHPLRVMLTRLAAAGSLIAVAVVLAVIVFGSGNGGSHATKASRKLPGASVSARATVKPGTASVPILAYHVINVAPPQSTAPASLYVPADEFASQMNALKAAGWQPVTLDQLQAYWTHGTPLKTGKPIVITFDSGYASQYTNALPVLKRLGWAAVENLQVNGLSPSDGGLTDAQIRGLIAAGWELDTDGLSQPDLTALSPGALSSEVSTARQTLHDRYNVPVNWFSYPSGSYNPTVSAAVHTAGFTGSTTLVQGWASPKGNRFRLPRLQVVGGTRPSALLSQIATAQQDPAPPAASAGP